MMDETTSRTGETGTKDVDIHRLQQQKLAMIAKLREKRNEYLKQSTNSTLSGNSLESTVTANEDKKESKNAPFSTSEEVSDSRSAHPPKPPKRPDSAKSINNENNPSPYVTMRKPQSSSGSAKSKKEARKDVPLPQVRPATVGSSVSKPPSGSPIVALPKRPETAKSGSPVQHVTVRRVQSSSRISNPSDTLEVQDSSDSSKTPVKIGRSHSALSSRRRQYIINNNVYIEITRIGKGGSSQVFQCFSNTHGCMVAVKIVDLEYEPKEVKEGFINEVRLLKKLQGSRHVIKLFDHAIHDDKFYVVLEQGETDFLSYLNENEPTPMSTKFYFSEMLKCVQAIHEYGVVHADLKPANFLLVKGRLKLIDFGIAAAIPADMTCAVKDFQSGTLNYMSPESFNIQKDMPIKLRKAADVWSLGCILYLMVFRRPPFAHYSDKKAAIIAGKPIDFKECQDEQLIDAIKKCLTYDYRRRPTVDEMLDHPYLQMNSVPNMSSFCSNMSGSTAGIAFENLDENFVENEAAHLEKLKLTPRSTVRYLAKQIVRSQSNPLSSSHS